jgi:hypothetical protein
MCAARDTYAASDSSVVYFTSQFYSETSWSKRTPREAPCTTAFIIVASFPTSEYFKVISLFSMREVRRFCLPVPTPLPCSQRYRAAHLLSSTRACQLEKSQNFFFRHQENQRVRSPHTSHLTPHTSIKDFVPPPAVSRAMLLSDFFISGSRPKRTLCTLCPSSETASSTSTSPCSSPTQRRKKPCTNAALRFAAESLAITSFTFLCDALISGGAKRSS